MDETRKNLCLYLVSVTLKPGDTYALRRLLHENGFHIWIENRITGERSKDPENYTISPGIIIRLDDLNHSYCCIYNRFEKANTPTAFPPQSVLTEIASHPSVRKYTISCHEYS